MVETNPSPSFSFRALVAGFHDVGGASSLTTLGILAGESLHLTTPPLKAWLYPRPVRGEGGARMGGVCHAPRESRSSAASAAALFTPAWTVLLSVANQTKSELCL